MKHNEISYHHVGEVIADKKMIFGCTKCEENASDILKSRYLMIIFFIL
jgi:hypothetical protein